MSSAFDHLYTLYRTHTIYEPPISKTGIWIPKARSALHESKLITPAPISSTKFEWGEIYHWKHQEIINQKPFIIDLQEEVENMPIKPPASKKFLKNCLSQNTPLCGSSKILQDTLSSLGFEFPGDHNQNTLDSVNKVKSYLMENLQYEYPPNTRNASDVIQNQRSDCAGYHSVFVALLRMLNIPAVMDFGARLPGCTPHVWAWWFNKNTNDWVFEDINDQQKGLKPSDRVSFTLGTGLENTDFPKQIQFIQNALIWDWHYNLHANILKKKVSIDVQIKAELT